MASCVGSYRLAGWRGMSQLHLPMHARIPLRPMASTISGVCLVVPASMKHVVPGADHLHEREGGVERFFLRAGRGVELGHLTHPLAGRHRVWQHTLHALLGRDVDVGLDKPGVMTRPWPLMTF